MIPSPSRSARIGWAKPNSLTEAPIGFARMPSEFCFSRVKIAVFRDFCRVISKPERVFRDRKNAEISGGSPSAQNQPQKRYLKDDLSQFAPETGQFGAISGPIHGIAPLMAGEWRGLAAHRLASPHGAHDGAGHPVKDAQPPPLRPCLGRLGWTAARACPRQVRRNPPGAPKPCNLRPAWAGDFSAFTRWL